MCRCSVLPSMCAVSRHCRAYVCRGAQIRAPQARCHLVVLASSCKLEAIGAVVEGIDLVGVFRRCVQALHRRHVPVFHL